MVKPPPLVEGSNASNTKAHSLDDTAHMLCNILFTIAPPKMEKAKMAAITIEALHCTHELCYALSRGGPDPDFRFRFKVPESGVGMDGASASRSLRRLCYRIWYLAMGGGHVAEHNGKASD